MNFFKHRLYCHLIRSMATQEPSRLADKRRRGGSVKKHKFLLRAPGKLIGTNLYTSRLTNVQPTNRLV